ncbi:hypothetical protein [Acidocella sp.]|jgi:hypothetical protein|uniref:hypothetical protein n=1 Tax=Acidocella sp. TaxID=50710 RepID=UPI002F3F58B5
MMRDGNMYGEGETAAMEGDAYDRLYPYHAELCALSELRKKPGFGVPVRSGMGGHCLLYLNGVRRDRIGYPTLKVCAPGEAPARNGVGISVNSHYRNANWVAAEGREFLWRGALQPGERLTREAYERTQDRAKEIGLLDGVQFHDHLFRAKPHGMSERDYMYEISVATDYAVHFGRDTYHARIPLDYERMLSIVAYLNNLNAPYRDGERVFRWRLFNNNCVHVVHNALAEAGIWAPWPTGQFSALAMFNFPVPKNEFVDLMLRANDLPIHNARAIHDDHLVRRTFSQTGILPTAPGALAVVGAAIRDNDVYDTERLRLIFYENPFWGPYRRHFARIFAEPRYTDLRANLRHFAAIYEAALRSRAGDGAAGPFEASYHHYIAREAERVRAQLASLDQATELLEEAVS